MYQHYILSQTLKRQKKKNTKRKKKMLVVLMYSNHAAERWVISCSKANRDHLSVSPSLISFHRLSAAHPVSGEGGGSQPPFLQARAPVDMQKPASLHRMTSKGPSVVKRNSRHSHIQAISLQSSARPVCFLLIPNSRATSLLFSLVLAWFDLPSLPVEIPPSWKIPVTQL